MEAPDRARIRNNLVALVAKTKWTPSLEVRLIENKVFTQKLLDFVKVREGDDRVRNLFLDAEKRGPNAFRGLVQSLVESDNHDAAKVLDASVVTPVLESPKQSKVWNPPTYDAVPIPPPLVLPAANEEFDVPEVRDDRTPLAVKVRRAIAMKGPPEYRAYPMTRSPRGQALIIDNEDFDNDIMPKREGSLIDANNLDILLQELGFSVTLRRNLGYNDMMTEIGSFSRHPQHANSDMCVVVILSHGDNGLIFAKDGRQIPNEWLLRQFNNDGCPALKGKPKFFILQACRGDEPDFGFVPRFDLPESLSTTAVDAATIPKRRLSSIYKDPTWEDMLIAYATIPGYVANRNIYRGTWFIESICEVFMKHAHDMDLREMLDEVSHQIRYYESEFSTKQSCSYEVRHFYKKLFFNPGLVGDPIERSSRTNSECEMVDAIGKDMRHLEISASPGTSPITRPTTLPNL